MDPSSGIPEEGPREGHADYSAGLIEVAPPVITNWPRRFLDQSGLRRALLERTALAERNDLEPILRESEAR